MPADHVRWIMAGHVGRPAVPDNVRVLRGMAPAPSADLGKFAPDVEFPECPPHLVAEAHEEYLRLGRELERYRLVSKVDRGVLAMVATAWARYVWAERKITELNLSDPNGEKGLVDRTPNDYKVMSVYLQISNAAIDKYLKLAAEFGLSPSSRSRVSPAAGGQLSLPGIEPGGEQGPPRLRDFAAA